MAGFDIRCVEALDSITSQLVMLSSGCSRRTCSTRVTERRKKLRNQKEECQTVKSKFMQLSKLISLHVFV
jgi:hypothetical protein